MFFLLGMLDRFKHYNNHLMIQNSIESQHIFKHHNNLINFYYSITQASQHIESHLQNVGQASQHRGASSSSSTASRSSWTSRPAASAPWCRSPTSKTQPPMLGKHRAVTHQALALLQDNYPEFIAKKVLLLQSRALDPPRCGGVGGGQRGGPRAQLRGGGAVGR
jgi:hypothetical protein